MIEQNRVFVWIAAATGALLLVPLVAMQFTPAVNWQIADFLLMGILIFSFASLFVLVSRRLPANRRPLIAGAFVLVFLLVWAELAVGIFTNLGD